MFAHTLLFCLVVVVVVVQTFSTLYQSIEMRLRSFDTLLRLEGRVDMLLAQAAAKRESDAVAATPAVEYNESDSESDSDDDDESSSGDVDDVDDGFDEESDDGDHLDLDVHADALDRGEFGLDDDDDDDNDSNDDDDANNDDESSGDDSDLS